MMRAEDSGERERRLQTGRRPTANGARQTEVSTAWTNSYRTCKAFRRTVPFPIPQQPSFRLERSARCAASRASSLRRWSISTTMSSTSRTLPGWRPIPADRSTVSRTQDGGFALDGSPHHRTAPGRPLRAMTAGFVSIPERHRNETVHRGYRQALIGISPA